MNITRLRLRLASRLLVILLAAVLSAGAVMAKLPEQQRVPADAVAAIGIPDTAALWTKVSALSITKAFESFLASPSVAGDANLQNFNLERAKLEQQLGFPFTPAEILTNIFSSALVYFTPAPPSQNTPVGVLVLGVKDPAKAAKLVEFADNLNTGKGSSAATTFTAPRGVTFEKLTLAGAQVSHVTVKPEAGESQTSYYTVAGDRFILTTTRPEMEKELSKAVPPQSIDQNSTFTLLTKPLPWDKSDVVVWIDAGALLGAKLGALTNNPMFGALGAQPKAGEMQAAFAIQVESDGIIAIASSTANPLTPGGPQPRKLISLNYLAPAPLLSMAYGLLDAGKTYEQINAMISMMSMMSALKGGQAAPSNPMTEAEQTLGISFEKELVPALGSELMLSLNSLQYNPMVSPIPSIDFLIGFEVRDGAKMKGIMDKIEKLAEEKMAALGMGAPGTQPAPGAPPAGPKFTTLPGTSIRTIATGQAMLSPSYVLTDKFLLIGLNPQSVQSALGRGAGTQPSAAKSPAFALLSGLAGTDSIYSYGVVDLGQASETILKPLLAYATLLGVAQIPPAQMQQATEFVNQIMPKLGALASLDTVKDNGLSMSFMQLKISPSQEVKPPAK